MDKVIFACVHNAGRSQMAAAFFNQLADRARAEAVSAGTQPGERVHPVVVDVMNEVGIDLSDQKAAAADRGPRERGQAARDDGLRRRVSVRPGLKVEDWPLQDPKDQPMEVVRQIRDDIKSRVAALVAFARLVGAPERQTFRARLDAMRRHVAEVFARAAFCCAAARPSMRRLTRRT